MALISTAYSIGWYGVESENACVDYDLSAIGTYDMTVSTDDIPVEADKWDARFVSTLGFTHQQAQALTVKYFDNGSLRTWNMYMEEIWEGATPVHSMECGQMYITSSQLADVFNIPGYYPSAEGVDMGRIAVPSS